MTTEMVQQTSELGGARRCARESEVNGFGRYYAKAVAIDSKRLFIGSRTIDPRSEMHTTV